MFELEKCLELLINCGKVRLKHEETGGKVSWKQELSVCLTNIYVNAVWDELPEIVGEVSR